MKQVEAARDRLAQALEACPRHSPTHKALSRLWMAESDYRKSVGQMSQAVAAGEQAERAALDAVAADEKRTSAWGWLGTMRQARSRIENDPAHLARAIEAWEQAARLDPNGPTFPKRLYDAHRALGQDDAARVWGRRVLETDAMQRLDPLKMLPESKRLAISRFVSGP